MFDLRRLVQIGRFARRSTAPAAGRILSPRESVKLVAITRNPEDSRALRQIAGSFGWNISIVDSSGAATALLKEQPTPLVICDSDLPGEDWRDVLGRIAALPQPICVLLASRVADQYLWNHVIQHHGYDLVVKPFQAEELRRAVTFAWSWRGWSSRHDAKAQGNAS